MGGFRENFDVPMRGGPCESSRPQTRS
jgi:hypothetical protein